MSFVLGSIPPLIPYMVLSDAFQAMEWAVGVSLLAAFGAGAIKSLIAKNIWWKSGLEMMLLGSVAAAIGFFVGQMISAVL